jgi:hypothetical protein
MGNVTLLSIVFDVDNDDATAELAMVALREGLLLLMEVVEVVEVVSISPDKRNSITLSTLGPSF